MDISSLKTELSKKIEVCEDYQTLYKSYYVMTSDKIEMKSKELFESRGIAVDSSDFKYFINDVLYDPNSRRSTEDTLRLVEAIRDGQAFDQDYVNLSYQKTVNIENIIDGRFGSDSLSKLLNYVPVSFSTNSVGKGEYAFVLLSNGAEKPKRGGDLFFNNEDIEVKANGAKMASQSTHIPQAAIKKDCIDWIRYVTGDEYNSIPNLTAININGFYYEVFGRNWFRVIEFLHFVFSKTMINASPEDLEWINHSLIEEDGSFDYFKFLEKLAIFEFTYYRLHDKFSRVLFLNVHEHRILNTDVMNDELIKKFKLTRSFSFKGERIQTNYWSLI